MRKTKRWREWTVCLILLTGGSGRALSQPFSPQVSKKLTAQIRAQLLEGNPIDTWPSSAWSIQFSRDGKRLISAGCITPFTAQEIYTESFYQMQHFLNHREKVFSGRGEPKTSRYLRVWDVATERQIFQLPTKSKWKWNMLISPDFKTMMVAWWGYAVDFYDIHSFTRQKEKRIKIQCGGLGGLTLSNDQKTLAVSTYCGVMIYPFGSKYLMPLNVGARGAGSSARVYFGPDNKTIACFWGAGSSKPQTIDITTARQVKHPFWFYRVRDAETFCFRRDGKVLAKVKGRNIEIWTTASPQGIDRRLKRLRTRLEKVLTMQFSPDGKTLVAAGVSRTKTPLQFFRLPLYQGEK